MPAPIVFISRWRVRPGHRDDLVAAIAAVLPVIESTKPRTSLFAAYEDDEGSELRILHVFPDGAAMVAHFEGADDRAASIADLMDPIGFDVYGAAAPAAVDELRRSASSSGAEVRTFPQGIGGVLRAPRD